ncbi:MAG: protein-L-isoaspartate(D-aspartate) O-methyltransferase [Burkholderiaceae bacterium]|nr:protein-L-isoaspartate(D-aspartate) O-methyltransferase [Burkholderiaceae bacterium]
MTQRRPGFPARIGPAQPTTSTSKTPARPVGASATSAPAIGVGDDSTAARAAMLRRLALGGVTSACVLQAMGSVDRRQFVDSGLGNQAYEDTSLPIGFGQTISKPSVVARMIELLLAAPGARTQGLGRVLEVGTGCGYQAAVLARLAREVYSIERLRGLHERARANLRPLRLANVHLIFGDGMLGFARGAPYAGILAAAGGAAVPAAWCEQLAVGGRLVAPVSDASGSQSLMVIDRSTQGFTQSVLESVHFVPLKSGIG